VSRCQEKQRRTNKRKTCTRERKAKSLPKGSSGRGEPPPAVAVPSILQRPCSDRPWPSPNAHYWPSWPRTDRRFHRTSCRPTQPPYTVWVTTDGEAVKKSLDHRSRIESLSRLNFSLKSVKIIVCPWSAIPERPEGLPRVIVFWPQGDRVGWAPEPADELRWSSAQRAETWSLPAFDTRSTQLAGHWQSDGGKPHSRLPLSAGEVNEWSGAKANLAAMVDGGLTGE